jgi:LytS/YehU family sensor histidine kinase
MVDDEVRLSEIVVPIIHNEKTIGLIDSENKQKNYFTKKDLETLQTIASICAGKISLSMAVEKMQGAVKQVKEVNSKMLETKFLNLRLQMNPHFLFNSLSSIQHLIVSKQTNEAYQYLSVFSNFLRSILQFADKTFITLDDELKMLGMYIKLESLGFDKTFTYDISVEEELDTEDILIPPLIIQPLVENAIWHGLMHKEGGKHFSVRFSGSDDDNLCCIVEDNGIGRQQAAAIDAGNLSNFAYQSKATALIKERLELLKQKTGKQASMVTEDKMDSGKPAGTRITIIIPYYNNEEI